MVVLWGSTPKCWPCSLLHSSLAEGSAAAGQQARQHHALIWDSHCCWHHTSSHPLEQKFSSLALKQHSDGWFISASSLILHLNSKSDPLYQAPGCTPESTSVLTPVQCTGGYRSLCMIKKQSQGYSIIMRGKRKDNGFIFYLLFFSTIYN